jgi:hypothetical protein
MQPSIWFILIVSVVNVGCGHQLPTALSRDSVPDTISVPRPIPQPASANWANSVVSEACYALSQNRSGTSRLMYQGSYMGDWPYPWAGDCCNALSRVTSLMYGGNTTWRGGLGTWNGYQQGGQCKFFVNLVLYRSSYGYPGGHLFLPSQYGYANRSWRDAQPGWVIQAPADNPHTALVLSNGGGWLDVIDANWVAGAGRYLISRHRLSASTLDAWGFRSYNPWENPRLVQ